MHPVEALASAIATQEGWFDSPPKLPSLRNNPGDLRYARQIGSSAPGWDGKGASPIATFSSAELGTAALFRQLWLQVASGQTVREIIAQWSPPNENNTGAYLENVLKWTGLPADVPVLELLPPLTRMNAGS